MQIENIIGKYRMVFLEKYILKCNLLLSALC